MSPTQRTLKHFRDLGYTCAITEHWNPFAKIRHDLFGFIDILAMGEVNFKGVLLAIQCTSRANHEARKTKILAEPKAKLWLQCGGRIMVVSWGKLKKTGWTLKEEEITLKDFT